MNNWGEWSTCDIKTGLQTRTRTIKTPAQGGGTACGSLSETQSCRQDCVYSTKVGDCDPNTKKKKSEITITTPARGGGTACPTELITYQDCNIDCVGVWNPDGKGCDPKTKKQTLVYKVNMDAIGGQACPNKTGETKQVDCDIDCVEGYEANWGTCNVSTGKQLKIWSVTTPALGNGKKCKSPTPAPQSQDCKVDCEYKYNYDDCVNGKRKGKLEIKVDAKNGGRACPTDKTKDDDCDMDCVGSWGSWTPENCPNGSQTRTYSVTQKKYGNGKACPYEDKTTETQTCSVPSSTITESNVDCVSSWSEFGDCIDGKKTKTYVVTTPSSGTGKSCETYNGATKTEDCSSTWYTNPLILGGIGVGVVLLIVFLFFMMKKNPSVPVV
jgi:hypothetical protein